MQGLGSLGHSRARYQPLFSADLAMPNSWLSEQQVNIARIPDTNKKAKAIACEN
jgi:hypothetical protein